MTVEFEDDDEEQGVELVAKKFPKDAE